MNNLLNWGLILFPPTLLAGFWLLSAGKPYKTGIFNLHKLIALGSGGLLLYSLYGLGRLGDSSEQVLSYFGWGGFLILLLFGSGALLSVGKLSSRIMVIVHRIGVGLAVVAVTYILYLQLNNRL